MASKQAREKAAQAWCTPETKDKVMDPDLAEAFANIIDDVKKVSFIRARKTMAKAMKKPDTHQGYKANIAMCIYDNRRKDGRLNHEDCNEVAEKLLKLIFD